MRHQQIQRFPGFIRKRLEKLCNIRIDGSGNCVDRHIYRNKRLQIDIFGNNNVIEIDKRVDALKLKLHIYGNNNHIKIGHAGGTLHLEIGAPIYAASENIRVSVGDNTWMGSVDAVAMENGSALTIGDDCAFANVMLWASDTHTIMDQQGQVLNGSRGIVIGHKVWFGKNTSVLKNSVIGDHSVVGWGSVVAGKFPQGHCVLAGAPAKIVRRDISWDPERPDLYKA